MAVNYNLEEVAEQMCDVYCRFPFILTENELSGVCESCPLDRYIQEETSEKSKA